LLKANNYILKTTFFYSLFILLLIGVPTYFYLQSEYDKYTTNQKLELVNYILILEKKIASINKEQLHQLPLSFNYDYFIYDKSKKLIFGTNKQEKVSFEKFEYFKDGKFYQISHLMPNRLEGEYLVVSKEFQDQEILIKIYIICLTLILFVFISLYFVFKATIEPLQKANMYLDRFFNDAMHELKTPLGVISINLEMLEEKIGKTKEIRRALNGVKGLNTIYDDIEYLIKHKRVEYLKEEIDFSMFLQQRIEFFEDVAYTKEIVILSNIDKDIVINFNKIELQRIVDNTISNAIKYSHKKGEVIVKLSQNSQEIVFSVQDFGIGIKDKVAIFRRYVKEDSIKGGFGLGLSIVKAICDKNEVDINVQTQLSQGSTFLYSFKS
jgi:two-component system, OmpR family, sensor kinase